MLDPSFISYVTVMSITPGPNNILLATSGVNFGIRRTLPMVNGILIGCALQTLIAGTLLDILLKWMSTIRLPLVLIGCLYLLWLSWKIFRARAPTVHKDARPMTFFAGLLFQAVNPKAWLMAINVALMYSINTDLLTIVISFMALNLPCILIWTALGDRLGKHLQVDWKLQIFNTLMAISLLITTVWMLLEALQL